MQKYNKVDYEEISKKLAQINVLTNKLENSFKKINCLIETNINSGKGIWDGQSASQFKSLWNNSVPDISTFITEIKKQEKNIEILINKTQETDQ